MSTQVSIQPLVDKMVFRNTNGHSGRHISVTPANSTNRHLCYGRIILDKRASQVAFSNADHETGFVVLSGSATIRVGPEKIELGRYDSIYIPRDSSIEISTSGSVDIAEFSSDVANRYPLQVVRFADISKDPTQVFSAGVGTGAARHLHMCLAKNVEAGRLVVGFTWSEPGNWTSWPPHEHAAMLEEMYVYFDMPAPAFGLQLVYNDTEYPELVTPVRDGDAVLMPSGFHPNVSVPGHRICFLWAMAAHRELVDRQFGVVNVQPGFDKGGSGLEAGRKKQN
ncbi:MAG TPA: 5-deoxy-glucuronate isomerase [Terriglobales bacterium]|nr:5-deoxy-glucuronate isomerase [Terriglobales bacterium]